MDIEPRRNPVRIRIKSGGKEHCSLDSLTKCFDVKDIEELLWGNGLLRWLKQNNENKLLEEIKCLQSSQSLKTSSVWLKLYHIFFNDLKKCKTLVDVFLYWSYDEINEENNKRLYVNIISLIKKENEKELTTDFVRHYVIIRNYVNSPKWEEQNIDNEIKKICDSNDFYIIDSDGNRLYTLDELKDNFDIKTLYGELERFEKWSNIIEDGTDYIQLLRENNIDNATDVLNIYQGFFKEGPCSLIDFYLYFGNQKKDKNANHVLSVILTLCNKDKRLGNELKRRDLEIQNMAIGIDKRRNAH